MAAKKPDDLRIVAARLQAVAGGRGRRSPLYQWLFQRADAFQRLLDDTQPSWKSIADALIDLGIRDGTGKQPNAECVRQAWAAVTKARRAKPAPRLESVAPLPRPPPVSTIPSRAVPDAADDEIEFELRTLTPRPKQQG